MSGQSAGQGGGSSDAASHGKRGWPLSFATLHNRINRPHYVPAGKASPCGLKMFSLAAHASVIFAGEWQ
ncbi:hypothetical protein D3C84_1099380 [compost metagenome]